MAGVTDKTTKEDLRERLRRASATIRGIDRKQKSQLQAVTERLRAKGKIQPEHLMQVIVSSTEDEWKSAVEFLEEFEAENLLPTALQRLAVGGRRIIIGHNGGVEADEI